MAEIIILSIGGFAGIGIPLGLFFIALAIYLK